MLSRNPKSRMVSGREFEFLVWLCMLKTKDYKLSYLLLTKIANVKKKLYVHVQIGKML